MHTIQQLDADDFNIYIDELDDVDIVVDDVDEMYVYVAIQFYVEYL